VHLRVNVANVSQRVKDLSAGPMIVAYDSQRLQPPMQAMSPASGHMAGDSEGSLTGKENRPRSLVSAVHIAEQILVTHRRTTIDPLPSPCAENSASRSKAPKLIGTGGGNLPTHG
jgi:hypothetical protein